MSDITTTVTISMKHQRQITEAEFKTMAGNLLEHIQGEHRHGVEGFAEASAISVYATHDVDGAAVYAAENQELEWVDAPAA
jgi:hypothetical protein